MKKFILVQLALLLSIQTFAQLTKRIADSSSVKFATRPKKGDKSLMLSFPLKDSALTSLKLKDVLKMSNGVIFKKYYKDRSAFRLGASVTRNKVKSDGTIADSSYYNPVVKPHLSSVKGKTSATEIIIKPGIEKHVSALNIFDVYAGSDLWLGVGKMNSLKNLTYTNGDYSDIEATMSYQILGLNAFTGFNVFIARLPLSLGLEYNWNGATLFNKRAKISQQDQFTTGPVSEPLTAEYIMQDKDAFGAADNNLYGKLKRTSSSWGFNNQIRLTANIYFK